MVYCVKCGTKNPDDAKVCSNCGTRLYVTGESEHYRRMEGECFGLPRGRRIFGLFIGLAILLAGMSLLLKETYSYDVPWWPLVVIAFGILLIAGTIYGLRRRS